MGRVKDKALPNKRKKDMTERFRIGALLTGFACLTALAFLGLGMMLGYQRCRANCGGFVVTDTIVVHDTLVVNRFFTDTVFKTRLVPYTFTIHDTVEKERRDSLLVDVPIESHHAHIEDTLDIWYSGFAARLDSLKVYNTTKYVTTEKTLIERKDPSLTANVGVWAVYQAERINPCLVGELRWNQPKTSFSAFGAIDHEGRWGAGAGVSYRMNIIK